MTRATAGLALATAILCALAGAGPAAAAKPAKTGLYIGAQGLDSKGPPGGDFLESDSYLKVSRTGRSLGRGSYVGSDCGRIALRQTRRRALRVRRGGRFRLVKRRGRLRVRLRGRFVTRGHAKIAYSVRRRGGCKVRRGRVGLYLNGQPPFSSCAKQQAADLVRGPSGRIFQQDRYLESGFYPHLYACLFETNKRFRLGRNYDDETIGPVDLAGPYAAYQTGTTIVVRDLRTGSVLRTIAVSAGLVGATDLEVKENGSVGWIAVGGVHAFDSGGRRQLDTGSGLQAESLRLSGSTLTWIRNGALLSATLN